LTKIVYDRVILIGQQPYIFTSEERERQLITKIGDDILSSGWDPDGVIAITKGGAWGMHLAAILRIPYACLATSHCTDQDDRMTKKFNKDVIVAEHMTTTSDLIERLKANRLKNGEPLKLLFIDDLADMGLTFDEVVFKLRQEFKESFEFRLVALWRKSKASCHVDFIGDVRRPHKSGEPVWIKTVEDQRYDDVASRINTKLLQAFRYRKERKR
jgi:hypoxanthine phosphoribosyltransferase